MVVWIAGGWLVGMILALAVASAAGRADAALELAAASREEPLGHPTQGDSTAA